MAIRAQRHQPTLACLCSLQSVCTGASGTVEHLDWSYALTHGSLAEQGRYILQSNDTSREVLHWDGLTGRKVTSNQRDAQWASWSCPLGFPVLGIWPDYANGAREAQYLRYGIGGIKHAGGCGHSCASCPCHHPSLLHSSCQAKQYKGRRAASRQSQAELSPSKLVRAQANNMEHLS